MSMRLSSLKPSFLHFTMVMVFILCVSGATAGTLKDEYKVKAALVYNFARFCEWPDEAFEDDPSILRVVIYGDKGLKPIFETINGMQVGERQIEVLLAETPESIPRCHLLFLAKTERDDWPQIVAVLGEDSVLTVGEMNGFIESAGVLNLHLIDNKVSFDVNLDQARINNIVISSRILKLASSVVSKKGAEK